MRISRSTTSWRKLIPATIVLITLYPQAHAFYREDCNATIHDMLANGTLQSTDRTVFYTNQTGFVMAEPDNLVLTLDGCEKMCGAQKDWYKDIGPRLNVWLIPVVLLIVNMEVSPIDKRRYWMVVHLLGDPVDSIWSLLAKVEAWSRCYGLALRDWNLHAGEVEQMIDVKSLATILGGIEEIVGSHVNPLSIFNRLVPIHDRGILSDQIRKTAFKLADSRTDELVRTIFAVILYLYQMISAFVDVIGGGNSSPPGGRIGTALFLTWLVPIILMSNSMGGFNSGTVCFDIIRDFHEKVDKKVPTAHQFDGHHDSELTERLHDSHAYFESQSWTGSIYTYICHKRPGFKGRSNDHSQLHLFLVATLPLINASMFASIILWNTPPVGLNCRNIMIIVMTAIWFLSAFLTWCISRAHWLPGRARWYMVLTKDAFIAIPSAIMIFLSCAGLFNSCRCWSAIYYLGRLQARIPLDAKRILDYNNKHLYPYLVGACLGMQLIIFAYMLFIGRKGLKVMRWSKRDKESLRRSLI